MTLVYTTTGDFTAYTTLPVVGWADAGTLLEEAQRMINMALGRVGPIDPATGLRINPAVLVQWRRDALSRATCAQAEYMLVKGPDFFIEQVPLDPTGPDGGQKGREPVIAPKADRELSQAALYRLTGRSQRGFPNQNVHDLDEYGEDQGSYGDYGYGYY